MHQQRALDRMIPLRRELDLADERRINTYDIKVEVETNPPENLNEDKRIDQSPPSQNNVQ